MQNEIFRLLLPLAIIAGGYYVKKNAERESHATANTWKWLVIIGSILFVVRLVLLIIKYV